MIKHISILYRPADKTHEEAVQYWKDVHRHLVKKLLPGLRKYVGNFPVESPDHAVKQPGGGRQMGCDAIVELHFDTLADLQRAMDSEGWKSPERLRSSSTLMDYTRVEYVVCEEVVVDLESNEPRTAARSAQA